MRNNIITVKYNEYSGKFTVKPAVYQWDYGLIMKIYGLELPDVTEWHFGNGEMTVTSIGDATSVSVPDECLEKTGDLRVYYIGHTGESDGETIYNFTIPVFKRPKPSDVEPTPVQQDVITQTIAALQTESSKAETAATSAKASAQKAEEAAASINEEMIEKAVSDYLDDHPVTVTEEDPTVPEWAKQANKPTYTAQEVGAVDINELPTAIDTALAQAKASGEFDGEPGPKGDKGDPGEDGYTPQKGVDYFDGAKGDTGSPGEDGFSPIANVSKSGNVATITVTDKTGTTSAQVSDGVNGENGSDGEDGITPIVSVTTITGGHNVAFSYGSGDSRNTNFDILDGQDGATGANGSDGSDGVTPTTTVTQITGGHNVAFSYGTGDSRNTNFNVMDGAGGNSPVTFGTESGAEGQSNPAVRQVGGVARATASGAAAFNYGVASASGAFAEGGGTNATGNYSHAEGAGTQATGAGSHAEGGGARATGEYSHAEGGSATASGSYSHAEGGSTIANHYAQHVFGENNVADNSGAASSARGNYVEIVGNGSSSGGRSNARTLDWSGNEKLAGSLTLGMGTNDETTITASQLASVLANQVVTQTVSGTDVTITGVANTRYVCGEVSTISITPPASGIIDVIFSSGSTVAVLTLPQTVKMPYWFEVEANKTYEINIMDGIYGAVMSWT